MPTRLEARSFRSLLGERDCCFLVALQLVTQLLDLAECGLQMSDDGSRNVLGLGQAFLGLGFGVA